jgi:hypothetical protein
MSARIAFPSTKLLAAWLLIGVGAPLVQAQSRPASGVIDGVVTDTNLVSLADATASILGSTIQVVTGANGRFRIHGIPVGEYILVVRRLGYAPSSIALQVAGGDTLRMSFALEKIATALDTVTITAKRYSMRMAEFEEHRKLGFGQFMAQAEIEKRNTVYVGDLVRTFLGVDVGETIFGQIATSHRFGGTFEQGICPFQVFLDGMPLSAPVNLKDLPSPKDLAGIELYSGAATTPLQYKTTSGGGFCGVILVWTKDGST